HWPDPRHRDIHDFELCRPERATRRNRHARSFDHAERRPANGYHAAHGASDRDLVGSPGASAVALQQAACDILQMGLGPLDLNLLGLTIHLDALGLYITAAPGAGSLLGNLLCTIAGLLDPGGPLTQVLNQLVNLLNQVIAVL